MFRREFLFDMYSHCATALHRALAFCLRRNASCGWISTRCLPALWYIQGPPVCPALPNLSIFRFFLGRRWERCFDRPIHLAYGEAFSEICTSKSRYLIASVVHHHHTTHGSLSLAVVAFNQQCISVLFSFPCAPGSFISKTSDLRVKAWVKVTRRRSPIAIFTPMQRRLLQPMYSKVQRMQNTHTLACK